MIELKAKSENYIPKKELEKAIEGLEKARDEIAKATAETDLWDLLNKEFEIEIEVEESAIADAAKDQRYETELAKELICVLDDAYIEAEYDDRDLAKPLLASDFNTYNFKRQMCDFFETGYHVDSFDLVKLLAEKLQVGYLL